MRSLIGLLVVLIQTTAAVQSPKVQGTVTDLQSNQPLSNVRVIFTGAAVFSTPTDSEGRFSFPQVTPGDYRVEATRDGFVWAGRQSGPAGLTVSAGESPKNVSFKLLKTSAISGRILDENGNPLSNLTVTAMQPDYRNGRRGLAIVPPRTGTRALNATDRNGEYRFYGLNPGEYYLRVASVSLGAYQAPNYYPGTTDIDTAAPVTIRPGQDLEGIDFRIRNVRLYAVRMKVELPNIPTAERQASASPPFLSIQARNSRLADFASAASLVTFANNSVQSARLPSGSYELTWSQSMPRLLARRTFEIKDRDEDLGVLNPSPGLTINGRLRMSDPQTQLKSVQVSLVSAGSWLPSYSPVAVDPDGGFTIKGVMPDDYWISIIGLPPNAYIESASYGARRSDQADILIGNEPGTKIEVVVGAVGGTANGIVRDSRGEPVEMSRVVLVPAGVDRKTNPSLIKTAQADAVGSFSIRGIPPGEYRLLAWEDALPPLYRDPKFLAEFEPRASKLSISGNARATAEVRIVASSQ